MAGLTVRKERSDRFTVVFQYYTTLIVNAMKIAAILNVGERRLINNGINKEIK